MEESLILNRLSRNNQKHPNASIVPYPKAIKLTHLDTNVIYEGNRSFRITASASSIVNIVEVFSNLYSINI